MDVREIREICELMCQGEKKLNTLHINEPPGNVKLALGSIAEDLADLRQTLHGLIQEDA